MDGGLASELQSCGCDIDGDPLWSGRVLASSPDTIKKVHRNYLEHGSSLLITSSYQCSIGLLVSHLGISEVEAGELIKRSVELAFKAVSEYHEDKRTNRPIWVAGSVGPYGACLHDGSEYLST